MEFTDLAALTIHDVKNRLAILAGRAEVHGDRETLHGILEAATALTRLLVFYKMEQGHLPLDIDAHPPVELLEDLAAEIGRQTTLTLHIDASKAPVLAYYDASLVRLVLLGAIYNALRHARKNITLAARQLGETLEFAVHDDGPGYPLALLTSNTSPLPLSRHGTGIGLQLARQVAELHRHRGCTGRICLENADGANFRLQLPQ